MPLFQAIGSKVTWNPNDKSANLALSKDLLTVTKVSGNSSHDGSIRATHAAPNNKDVYWEVHYFLTSISDAAEIAAIATADASMTNYIGSDANGWSYVDVNGQKANNGSGVGFGATHNLPGPHYLMVALSMRQRKVWFGLDGQWQGAGASPETGTNPAFSGLPTGIYPALGMYNANYGFARGLFGKRDQKFGLPRGYEPVSQALDISRKRYFIFQLTYDIGTSNAVHSQSSDNLTLTQVHSLSIESETHAQITDSPTLTQVHSIAVADAGHAQVEDSPAFSQVHVLILSDALHEQLTSEASIQSGIDIIVDAAEHGQSAAIPGLTQQHVITAVSALHGHAAEAPTLSQTHAIAIADALHAHLAANPALTQDHVLLMSGTLHAHLSSQPDVFVSFLYGNDQVWHVDGRGQVWHVLGRPQVWHVPKEH